MRCLILLALFALFAAATAVADEPPRTLDSVTIEGEIDVPQVLFISSRDHLRFHDDTGDHYRPSALDVILGAVLPTRLCAVPAVAPLSENEQIYETEQANEPTEPRSESPRADKE